jgi:hypothetical protein
MHIDSVLIGVFAVKAFKEKRSTLLLKAGNLVQTMRYISA